MSPRELVVDALLVVAGAAAVLSVAGVALMPGTHNRLHYLAPVSVVGGAAVAVAVVVAESFNARGIKALIVFVLVMTLNPLLVHATARAARARARTDEGVRPWGLSRPSPCCWWRSSPPEWC